MAGNSADGTPAICCTSAVTGVEGAQDRQLNGVFAVCLAGVIWGTIGPGLGLVYQWSGLSPWIITAYRVAAAVVALLAVALVRGRLASTWSAARQEWRRVVAVGLLTAAFLLLFFLAVIAAGVSVATVVALGFAPVLLLILSCLQERRLPSAGRSLTVAAAVVGLLLVSVVGDAGQPAPHPVLGILAALTAGGSYALSAEVGKPLSHRLGSQTLTTATLCVAAAVLVPGGVLVGLLRGEALGTADLKSWLAIIYLGVVTMAVAYTLFFTGLRNTSSGSAMVATLIEPVAAVILAVVFMHERLSWAGVLGCLLILSAIASLSRQPKQGGSDDPPDLSDLHLPH